MPLTLRRSKPPGCGNEDEAAGLLDAHLDAQRKRADEDAQKATVGLSR
jgi:hypothetical protein